jgi:hypothetical protein
MEAAFMADVMTAGQVFPEQVFVAAIAFDEKALGDVDLEQFFLLPAVFLICLNFCLAIFEDIVHSHSPLMVSIKLRKKPVS